MIYLILGLYFGSTVVRFAWGYARGAYRGNTAEYHRMLLYTHYLGTFFYLALIGIVSHSAIHSFREDTIGVPRFLVALTLTTSSFGYLAHSQLFSAVSMHRAMRNPMYYLFLIQDMVARSASERPPHVALPRNPKARFGRER